MEEKVKDYFTRYPNSGECFENGGLLFHTHGAAESYGKTETKRHARKKETIEVPEEMEEVDDEAARLALEEEERKAEEEAEKRAALKASTVIKLSKMEDLGTIPYDEMKVLVKILELKPADNKKETLLSTLSEYKESLKDE